MTTLTLEQIADLTNSELVGDPSHEITGIESLDLAGPDDISFLDDPKYGKSKYEKAMRESNAGAIFIIPSISRDDTGNYLLTSEPSKAFQQVLEHFHSHADVSSGFEGIHPTAVIHPGASLAADVTVHPQAVIDRGVVIGPGTVIGAACVIGPDVTIGEECL